MVLSKATYAAAAAMGKRAGQARADTGTPTRNPFSRDTQPELADEWGHAYIEVTAAPPKPPPDALTASAGSPNTGVAIMATVDASYTTQLVVEGAAPPEAPGFHITLGYLAEPAASYTPEQRAALMAALAAALPPVPLIADVFGQAVLNEDDSERDPALVALVQSDSVAAAHDAVTDACETAGVELSDTFPVWLAHVTLGYNLTAEQFPPRLVGTSLNLGAVVVAWGEDVVPVDLAGNTDPEPLTAAVEAPVTAPAPTTGADPVAATGEPVAVGGDTTVEGDLTPEGLTWSGPLAMLDQPSSDNRLICSTGGTIRPLPQPLNWQRESDQEHKGSTKVGRILAVEVRGPLLWGSGDWLDPMVNYEAQQAMAEVDAGLGFISVDLAVRAEGYALPDGTLIDPEFAPADADDVCLAAVEWEFGGATLVSFAAFADARITNDQPATASLGDEAAVPIIPMPGDGLFATDPAAPAADAATTDPPTISTDGTTVDFPDGSSAAVGDPIGYVDDSGAAQTGTVSGIKAGDGLVTVTPPAAADGTQPADVDVPVANITDTTTAPAQAAGDESLVAAALLTPYTRALFEQRPLDGPTPMTYDPATGAVYGHVGQWGQCHIGKLAETGKCVTVPEAPDGDYSYFQNTPIPTDDGDMIAVGRLTVGAGHAGPLGGMRAAMEHYDNSGAQVALVRAYEDAYGVAVFGQVIHGTPPERIEEMLRSPMSGDWRLVDPSPGAPLRLVAALGVNVPGFPIVPKWGMAGKRQVSLVAAGVVRPVDIPADEVTLPNGQTMDTAAWTSLVAATMSAIEQRATDDEALRMRHVKARLTLSVR